MDGHGLLNFGLKILIFSTYNIYVDTILFSFRIESSMERMKSITSCSHQSKGCLNLHDHDGDSTASLEKLAL